MFLAQTAAWQRVGTGIVADLKAMGVAALGLVLVAPGATGPEGFAHNGDWRCYPCSLVKAFHLVHALAALEAGRLVAHGELDRALRDMILWSSNTATNYVIDLLTGTTGDTLLEGSAWDDFVRRRQGLNGFYAGLGWAEFAACNLTQKLMDDVRYGREAVFAGVEGVNLNALTPLCAARLLWELFEGTVPLSAAGRARAQGILQRDPQGEHAGEPDYQLSDYLGGDLPVGVQVWSKAGHNEWTGDARASWFKHDMIRIMGPGRKAVVAVLMTQGRAVAEGRAEVFPAVGRLIWERCAWVA